MLKKLHPFLALVNQLLADEIVHHVTPQEDSVRLDTTVGRVQLRTPELEGLTIEDIRVTIEDLVLPGGGSKDLAVTFRLDHVRLLLAASFFTQAAKVLHKSIIAPLGKLLDTVVLDGLRVKAHLSGDKILSVEIRLDRVSVEAGGSSDIRVENLRFSLKGLDLKEEDKKKALSLSQVTLDRLAVHITEEFLNRAIETFRDKIPSVVTSLGFALKEDRMIVTAKTKLLPMAIPTELTFSTERNLFGIYIVKVLVGMARPLILKAVQWFAANRPEIEAADSHLYINPWAKIPVPVTCNLSRFAVADRCIVVEFTPVEPEEEALVEEEPAADAPIPLIPVP